MSIIPEQCPVCGYSIAHVFFDAGRHPLATLGWPKSKSEAQQMEKLPQLFVRCNQCTHVWNKDFSYDSIPYQKSPNRMFNTGNIWKGHLANTRNLILNYAPINPVIIDVGCGEGHFVRGIAEHKLSQGRFIGFDPSTSDELGLGIEFYAEYFDPLKHVEELQPDIIIMRHVLEHLTDPANFIDQLSWSSLKLKKPLYFFAEMPCIDRVFDTKRLADFFYEHPSHFTTQSFTTLMKRGGEILELAHGYGKEVIYALVKLETDVNKQRIATESSAFLDKVSVSKKNILSQLQGYIDDKQKIAIWGGTGKAAAFIHQYSLDVDRFPLVVDSDYSKVGTYVPETGQKIEYRDILKKEIVNIIIIPTQWRAKDILLEIESENISFEKILIEHSGMLIDFLQDEHPYC